MKLISIIHRRPGGRRARPVPPLPIAASLALLLPLSFAALASPAAAVAHPGGATRACPWLNQSLPISQRVRLLLSKMTLANEITMVEGQGTASPTCSTWPRSRRCASPRWAWKTARSGSAMG